MSGSLPRFLLRAAALTVVLGGVAWVLVGAVVGPEARGVVPWAAGAALLGLTLGRLAGLLVPAGRPESPAQAALLSLGVRLCSTAGLALVALQVGVAPATTFALVLGALYLSLLVLEVSQAVAEVRSAAGRQAEATSQTRHDDGSGAAG